MLAHCHLPFLKNQLTSLRKSKSVWHIKKVDAPVDFPVNFPDTLPVIIPKAFPIVFPVNLPVELDSSIDVHEGIIPLISVNCEKKCLSPVMSVSCANFVEPIDVGISDSTLKPLSLTTMVDFEEGNLINFVLKPGLVNLYFILGKTSLKDLGFTSPIKDIKRHGSGYFLRSSSKVLDTALGFKSLLTPTRSIESVKGIVSSDDVGVLRDLDTHVRVLL